MSYDVFLSHSTADKPFVRALADWLRQHEVTFFLDEKDLQPGDRLTEKLGTAMEASRSAIICIGPHGEGPWQAEEIDSLLNKAIKLSRKLDEFRIIPVLLPGADTSKLRWFLETRLWVNLSKGITDGEAELFRLRHAITGTAADAPIHDDPTFNPYRGLKAFEEKDAAFFFGRARECRVLAAMIEEWRFACIVGPSGNGKSSLARAGLATDGAEAACPGIRGWTRISAVPGGDLLRAIMVRLFAGLPEGERAGAVDAAVKRAIPEPGKWTAETWASGLDHELKAGFPDPQQGVLILVDQFEEIFTHRGLGSASDEERQARIRIILDALALIATCDDKRWRFVFTLRADFFQRCRVSDSFWKLVSADRLNLQLDELDEEGWREAIKGPAARAGAYLEAGLVETMLKDVYRQRGSMPLLQLALHQLWRLRQGACLTHAAYSSIGGVANALQNRAETALSHLGEEDPEYREIARNLFLRLTSPGEGVSDTRRRLDRSELAWENTESKKVDHVLADLSGPDNRLLVADDHSIEVTHEVLIRDCGIIRGWIERDRKDIPVLRRLTHAAQRWAGNNRDAIFLNAADPPRELKQWMKKTPLRLTDLEREYWKASRADRTRALQEKRTQRRALLESERGRANEAVRQACTRQRFLIAVVVVSLAAIGVFAYFNHRANVEKARALELIRFMDAQVGQAFVDAVPVQLRERVSARVDAFYTEQGGLTAVGDHERMGYYLRKAQVHLAAVDRYQKDATFNEDAKGVYIGWERASAADALRESLRLGESLARKIENKADRSVTRDRILAHFHLSALSTQLEDSDGAGEHLKAARALLDAMVQDGPFSAVQLVDWMDLPNLDAATGDHAGAEGDQKSAQGWYQKALALQTALVALRPTDQAQAQKSEETRVSKPKTREEVLEEIQAHLKKTAP